jgi:hypothetical protein
MYWRGYDNRFYLDRSYLNRCIMIKESIMNGDVITEATSTDVIIN